MNWHRAASSATRSRSPRNRIDCTLGFASTDTALEGACLQFFHEADPADPDAIYVCRNPQFLISGPKLLLSHGWLDGELHANFSWQYCDSNWPETWPLIAPRPPAIFVNRQGQKIAGAIRTAPWRVRDPSAVNPVLSLVFIRWAGEDEDSMPSGPGGWGVYGNPTSSAYLSAFISEGVMKHPRLQNVDCDVCDAEVLSLFVSSSEEVQDIVSQAPVVVSVLRGSRIAGLWMLWPTEWKDGSQPVNAKLQAKSRTPPFYWKQAHDYVGFIDRHALFGAMRACEAVGLRSCFPHPADLYELITSKSWMASLCLQREAHLPAAVRVSKGSVLSNPKRAAKQALAALDHIRNQYPFPTCDGEPSTLSSVNRDGVKKGVVKLGWSWEAHYVLCFKSEAELEKCLLEMLTYEGCASSCCIVQEWVDFDFEMRWYFFPPQAWVPGTRLHPIRCERTRWTKWGDIDGVHSPSPESGVSMNTVSESDCLREWQGDSKAWELAQERALDISQHLLTWLLSMDSQPVPMIRLDFMVKRWDTGKARVVFGEFCEAGACCLSWEKGPEAIWRAAIDSAMS